MSRFTMTLAAAAASAVAAIAAVALPAVGADSKTPRKQAKPDARLQPRSSRVCAATASPTRRRTRPRSSHGWGPGKPPIPTR